MKHKFTAVLMAAGVIFSAVAFAGPEVKAEKTPVAVNAGPTASPAKKVESLSLNNVTMKEAARLIALATETPIVVSNAAAGKEVDVHLQNVTAEVALKAICQASGLWYQKNDRDGVLNVMTLDEFKNTIQFDRTERVEVVQILYPSARDVGDAIYKLYVDRVIWLDPRKNSGDHYTEIVKALKRMDALGDRGTFDIVEENTGDADEDDDDDDDDDIDKEKRDVKQALNVDLGKVSDTNLQQLFRMGQKAGTASIQARKLLNVPGVVFISVLPENNSLMMRSCDSLAIDEMLKLVKKLDKPVPQVLLEVKVLSVLLDDGRERSLDFLFAAHDNEISGGFSNGAFRKPTSYDDSTGIGLDLLGDPKTAVFSAVSKHFKLRLQMLEKDNRLTQLATPNLVVSNNESTTLFIGSETTVMEKAESTTTYQEVSSGVFQPNISWEIDAPRRKIGTSLLLTPKIHADRSVTIRLLQEKSTLGGSKENVYSGGTGSESTTQYFTSQDIDMQRIVTTVVGQDREFLVIGGMINEKVGKEMEKIPGLSSIPYIGELLFSRMKSVRQREEILIIVRPFVMTAPGDGQTVSQEYLDRMSQHPAAREDLPSLGVNAPEELAKPKIVNPNDPWFNRMVQKLRGWEVDDSSEFNVGEQLKRKDRRMHHQEALKEIERIKNNEK